VIKYLYKSPLYLLLIKAVTGWIDQTIAWSGWSFSNLAKQKTAGLTGPAGNDQIVFALSANTLWVLW